MTAATQQAIIQAAREEGIDPSLALAIAQRESSFDTTARNSKTIRGAFQMTGGLRSKYGIGDSDDAYTQAKGWSRFIKDVRGEMSGAAGRDVSDAELYSGHHFGGARAGRMLRMDPATPVETVFTRQEMAQNPHFARAGTVGALLGDVTGDIQRRQAKFGGGELPDFSPLGEPVDMPPANFAQFGEPVEGSTVQATGSQAQPAAPVADAPALPPVLPRAVQTAQQPDFSSMGAPVT